MSPVAIHTPTSLTELRELVASAAADRAPLAVSGHGSKDGFGRPVEARFALSTAGLSGIDLYEPAELVMSAGAGTPLREVEAMLAEREQMLAFEPADYGWLSGGPAGDQTIGGVFACNLAGPRRLKIGAARDHLLGVQCVTGRGEVIKTGGRVVKNVTGYDLCKLLTGSFGTLAVMSRLTFKVLPKPETEATLLLFGPSEQAMLTTLRRAVGSAHEVASAALVPALAGGRSGVGKLRFLSTAVAALRLEGPAPSVAYRLEALERELADEGTHFDRLDAAETALFWAEVRDVRLLTHARPLWRVSLPPAAAGELAPWLAEVSHERLFDWAGGLVWLAMEAQWADAADILRRAFDGRGGHATLIRGPIELRRNVEVFEPLAPALKALSRRVKTSFDPHGVLNPGRMYPDF